MARPGRPALLTPTVEWKVRVPVDLAAKADLLSLDPVRGTIAYGARSALVTQLLREHLASLTAPSVEKHLDSLGKSGEDGHSINGDNNSPINLPENSHD